MAEAIDVLVEQGPALGRPLVDRLKGSAYHNMKELRPGSAGRWQTWYQSAIRLADARFAEHLAVLKAEEQS